MVGGATMIDPPEDEPQDTHFYLYLTGHSAKALFDMLQVPAEYDECLDDGSRTKIVENMHCTVSGDETSYECHFAIDVGEQKIVLGSVC